MVVNHVVNNRACVIVHGLEDVGSGYDKWNFLCKVFSVFYHVTSFVDCLLDQVELFYPAFERVLVKGKYLLQIPHTSMDEFG